MGGGMKIDIFSKIRGLSSQYGRTAIGLAVLLAIIAGQTWGSAAAFAQANTSCNFQVVAGPAHARDLYNVDIQTWLYAYLDGRGNYWGGVFAKAVDYMQGGCFTMKLVVQYENAGWVPGWYTQLYHCTAGTYTFYTPVGWPATPGGVKPYHWS